MPSPSWTPLTREQLANATSPQSAPLADGLPPIAGVTTKPGRACAWTHDGKVWCWGRYGRMGSDPIDLAGAVLVVDFVRSGHVSSDVPIRAVALRGDATCALLGPSDDGPSPGAWCWQPSRQHDGDVARLERAGDFTTLAAGNGFACVLDARGGVSCWGCYGCWDAPDVTIVECATFDGPLAVRPDGIEAVALDAPAQALVARDGTACALTADGAVWCWGGEVGYCQSGARGPRRVEGLDAMVSLSLDKVLCGVDVRGEVHCAEETARAAVFHTPARVTLRAAARSVDVGADDACATLVDGTQMCWSLTRPAPAL